MPRSCEVQPPVSHADVTYASTMKGSWLSARRATDAERERTVRVLREATVQGQLSHDSFMGRIDQALAARDRDELWNLVADLDGSDVGLPERPRKPVRRRMLRYPVLRLPSSASPILIGRRRDCDIVISDASVSRLHAILVQHEDAWVLADHNSTNGTRVNGDLLVAPSPVYPGDLLRFGLPTFQLARPSRARHTNPLWDTSGNLAELPI